LVFSIAWPSTSRDFRISASPDVGVFTFTPLTTASPGLPERSASSTWISTFASYTRGPKSA
jgi:hypothetical protein